MVVSYTLFNKKVSKCINYTFTTKKLIKMYNKWHIARKKHNSDAKREGHLTRYPSI